MLPGITGQPSITIEFYTAVDDQEHVLAWLEKALPSTNGTRSSPWETHNIRPSLRPKISRLDPACRTPAIGSRHGFCHPNSAALRIDLGGDRSDPGSWSEPNQRLDRWHHSGCAGRDHRHAAIQLENPATGEKRATASDTSGNCTLAFLSPGVYELTSPPWVREGPLQHPASRH